VATSDRIFPARRGAWLGALVLAAACGCSGPGITFAPVEGTVTRNGRPVPHAQVIFFADGDSRGPRAVGVTDEAGRFRLAADDGTDGAPVGSHRVCVIDASGLAGLVSRHAPETGKKPPASVPRGKTVPIPPQYARPTETPLRAEVRPGAAQTIDFQIP